MWVLGHIWRDLCVACDEKSLPVKSAHTLFHWGGYCLLFQLAVSRVLCSLNHHLKSKKVGLGKGQYVSRTVSSNQSLYSLGDCFLVICDLEKKKCHSFNPFFVQMTAVSLQQYDLPDLENYVRRVTVCMQTSQYPKQVSAAVGRYLWYTEPEDASDLWSNFYDVRIIDEWWAIPQSSNFFITFQCPLSCLILNVSHHN